VLRFLTDQHFPTAVIRGLLAREPALEIVRVSDVGLSSAPDPQVLTWAAATGRVVVSADRQTMIGFGYARLAAGEPFTGLVIYDQEMPIGRLIDDLLIVAHAYTADEIAGQVIYLPL
jgi:predicted nuclease of predicted toxin-antitoxin system